MIDFLVRVVAYPAMAYLVIGGTLVAFAAHFVYRPGDDGPAPPPCPCDRHTGRIAR